MRRLPPGPGSLAAWLLAARPKTLPAAVVPVVVGAAVAEAYGGLRVVPSLVTLAAALLIQVGTNLANDLFDYEKGADTEERTGPTRAVQAGLLTAPRVRRGMAASFGLAFLAGVYLAWVAGWPILALGVAGILSGLAYTAGPYPLGYHGLGDLFVLVFFGFAAVCGTAYVNLGRVPEIAWWAAVPVGCLATAILVVNNVRDRVTDERAGKRTVVVRLGRAAGVVEYVVLLLAAYAVPVYLAATHRAEPWILLPLVTLPLRAPLLVAQLLRDEGWKLNDTLAGTARLLLFFGALLAAGIVLGVPAGHAGHLHHAP